MEAARISVLHRGQFPRIRRLQHDLALEVRSDHRRPGVRAPAVALPRRKECLQHAKAGGAFSSDYAVPDQGARGPRRLFEMDGAGYEALAGGMRFSHRRDPHRIVG